MELGDYEEELPTAILGGADESWNVDDKRDLHCRSRRGWLAGSRSTCDDIQDLADYSNMVRTGACLSGSVSPSTYKLLEGRDVWLRFAELSDRPTSLVYRVPVTAPNLWRTHQFTLPGRINSQFTAFRGGKDLCFHPSTRAIAIRENSFHASQRQTHLHATCTTGRTRRGAEAGRKRRGFSDHEPIPAAVPIESARETTQREDLEVGA